MPKYMIFYANFYAHQLYFMTFLCYTEKEGIYPEFSANESVRVLLQELEQKSFHLIDSPHSGLPKKILGFNSHC